jgi:hypothetical protein
MIGLGLYMGLEGVRLGSLWGNLRIDDGKGVAQFSAGLIWGIIEFGLHAPCGFSVLHDSYG